jgi:hypothetical protein
VPAALGLTEEALLATKDIEQEEHGRRDTMFPVARSWFSDAEVFREGLVGAHDSWSVKSSLLHS